MENFSTFLSLEVFLVAFFLFIHRVSLTFYTDAAQSCTEKHALTLKRSPIYTSFKMYSQTWEEIMLLKVFRAYLQRNDKNFYD